MSGCLSLEAIARPGRWTAAERAHVEGCPRCAAHAARSAEFVAGRTGVPAVDLADAEARLDAFLAGELGLGGGVRATPGRAIVPETTWSRIAAWFAAPAGRMVAGLSVVVLVAGGVIVMRGVPRAPAVLRGDGEAALAVSVRADTGAAAVMLRWGAAPGADAYTIEILAADLSSVARFGPVDRPEFALARGAVRALPPGTSVYCRVTARRAGVPVAESAPASLRLP